MGNVFTALISWLSARSKNGRWILRIEDLDPQRSKPEYARMLEDDLQWLGLDWDEGGTGGKGENGPYLQSLRTHVYDNALHRLEHTGLTYPCFCTRAALHATQAPHASDGTPVYPGTCRPGNPPFHYTGTNRPHATRICVPDTSISFTDKVYGVQRFNLARQCGDFVLRRADGAYAYQLAVTVDDAMMGVTEVVRGYDLLASTPRQLYIYSLLGLTPPTYAHIPLLNNQNGIRLSKRDSAADMAYMRAHNTPQQILGKLAHTAGITGSDTPIDAQSLVPLFEWTKIPRKPAITI